MLGERNPAKYASVQQGFEHLGGWLGQRQGAFVEEGAGEQRAHAVDGGEPLDQPQRVRPARRGSCGQPLGAHERHVDGRRGHQQALIGANVGGGLAAPDVLLPGLQGEAVADAAAGVLGLADDAAGQLPCERGLGADETERGAAGTHGGAQRLAISAGDVGTGFPPLARRLEHRQGERVDHADHRRALALGPVGQAVGVLKQAEKVGLLKHHGSEGAIVRQALQVAAAPGHGQGLDLDPLVGDDVARRVPVVGMQGLGHQHPARAGLAGHLAHRHQDGLREARCPVIDAGVGCVHASQRAHH